MSFEVRTYSEVAVFEIAERLIVGNRQDFRKLVLAELEKGARKIIVDFARTCYVDSAGLGVLVSLSTRIRQRGGALRIAGLNDDLRTIFELTRLDVLFELHPTRDHALLSFLSTAPPPPGQPPARNN